MTTITDRLLRRIGFLPAPPLPSPIKQTTSISRIEDLQQIPRYPPFMEGLPVYSPEVLLSTQREMVGSIRHLIADADLLANHYDPAISRLAAFVQLLPASQAHHHRGAGGMLRHALEVGFWSLQQTEGKLIRGITTPQQRRVFEPRWRLAVFLAGICHDLGKVVTDFTVTDRTNSQTWRPYHQGVHEWAVSHDISSYFLHWRDGRGKSHTNVSSTLMSAVISKDTYDWIGIGSTEAVIWLAESLNNNPGPSNQIHGFVVRADQLSVERDLKSMGVAMAGYEVGVPVERYLTDIMRRLVQEGLWRINEPGARVWNIGGNTYLVWPMAGEEIARRIREEDIPGLPKTPDGILDMMVERDIVLMREGNGDPCFYIAPEVLTDKLPELKLKCVRLRDQALISTMPIAPVSGKIVENNPDEPDVLQHLSSTTEQKPHDAPKLPDVLQTFHSTPETRPVIAPEKPDVPQHTCSTAETNARIKATNAPAPPQHACSTSEKSSPNTQITLEHLTGSMGELLKALIEDFRTGKKSFAGLTTLQHQQLYLMWPHAFAGYGYTPKQILDGLTERGWMKAMSEVAKVGDMNFADGAAKAIRLTDAVSRIFTTSIKQERSSSPVETTQKPKPGKSGAAHPMPVPSQSQLPIDAEPPKDAILVAIKPGTALPSGSTLLPVALTAEVPPCNKRCPRTRMQIPGHSQESA